MKSILAVLVALIAMVGVGAAATNYWASNINTVLADSGVVGAAILFDDGTGYNVVVNGAGSEELTFASALGATCAAMALDGEDSDDMSVVGVLDANGRVHMVTVTEDKARELFDMSNAGKSNSVGAEALSMYNDAIVKAI